MEVEIASDYELRNKKKRRAVKAVEQKLPEPSIEKVPAGKPGEEQAEQVKDYQQAAVAEPVMVRVVRVCPNPRLVDCIYSEGGGTERRVLVRVKSNAFFRRGMEIEVQRSARENEPWSYTGRLPRHARGW
jgi:hypothetical protein